CGGFAGRILARRNQSGIRRSPRRAVRRSAFGSNGDRRVSHRLAPVHHDSCGIIARNIVQQRTPMSPEESALLKRLLTRERVLSLAVVVENAPVIGLLPFMVTPEFDAALIHASGLAKHTAGLRAGAPF